MKTLELSDFTEESFSLLPRESEPIEFEGVESEFEPSSSYLSEVSESLARVSDYVNG